VTVSVEAADTPADRVTLAGLKEADKPDGVAVDVRATVPANPPRLLRVIVELPD